MRISESECESAYGAKTTRQHIAPQSLPRKVDFMRHFMWLKLRANKKRPGKGRAAKLCESPA
jgi:predicted transcriptional regulator